MAVPALSAMTDTLLLTNHKQELSAEQALQRAWWIWFTLLTIPFIVFLCVMWRLTAVADQPRHDTFANAWFIGTMLYMAVVVPCSFFARSRMFRGYLSGHYVEPREYLRGMVTVWLALEIGGIIALLGCLLTNSLLPNLLPALVAFMLFTPLWPSGNAMTQPPMNERDPGPYAEPR